MSEEAQKSKKTAVLAIIIAVIFALLLVGLGYAAYEASDLDGTINKPTTKNTGSIPDANELPAENQPVNSEEIKQQIDQLSEDFSKSNSESADFSEDELSDESLGL